MEAFTLFQDWRGSNEDFAQKFLDGKIRQRLLIVHFKVIMKMTVGDNNNIFGNLNQGNQDFSVNINGGTGNRHLSGGMSNCSMVLLLKL